jgi:hypothetical protein
MHADRQRLATVALCVLSAIAGVWLGWNASGFIAQDRCLDAGGGSWNPETRYCEFAEAN